jgi:hypothetical protein
VEIIKDKSANYLIFTSAGRNSNIKQWMKDPSFDLFTVDYCQGDSNSKLFSNYYLERKGGKFQNIHFCYSQWPEIFLAYDAIMVMDDDIIISSKKLHELFDILIKENLSVLQPAFCAQGKISHSITKVHAFSRYRKTNFVEVTCPVFKTSELTSFLDKFDPIANGGGVDWWFCHHAENRSTDHCIAVIDSVVCLNPHDIRKGGTREIDLFRSKEQRNADWALVRNKHNLTFDEGTFKTYEVENRYNLLHITYYLADNLLSYWGRFQRKIQSYIQNK